MISTKLGYSLINEFTCIIKENLCHFYLFYKTLWRNIFENQDIFIQLDLTLGVYQICLGFFNFCMTDNLKRVYKKKGAFRIWYRNNFFLINPLSL